MTVLIDVYDGALFDLDGVVYLGGDAIPGVAAGLAALRQRGVLLGYVTNNAGRGPQDVADHLVELGIECTAGDVITSAQALARVLVADLRPGSTVLVMGSPALEAEVAAAGLTPTRTRRPAPAAVVCGFWPDMRWNEMNEACLAVQNGARWYATNPDLTRPLPDGESVGVGGILAAMRLTMPHVPLTIAGKPFRPLLDETMARLGVRRPIFVGDRLDTDVEGANNVGIDSLFVLSGSHGKDDLVGAEAHQRPTVVGWDLRALLEPVRPVRGDLVTVEDDALVLTTNPTTRDEQLDALWSVAHRAWAAADSGRPLDATRALVGLDRVR